MNGHLYLQYEFQQVHLNQGVYLYGLWLHYYPFCRMQEKKMTAKAAVDKKIFVFI